MGAPAAREAVPATAASYELAEGPRWDAGAGLLRWVDILGARVHIGLLEGGTVVERASWSTAPAPATLGAAIAPAFAGSDAGTLLAAHDRLLWVDADGGAQLVARLIGDDEPRRLNDATTDPRGRCLVGSAPLGEAAYDERLWLVDADGTATLLDDDLGLSNGLAFSPDGGTLYSVDTFRHVVRSRPYDAGSGTCGPRTDHVRIDDAFPDGIAADSQGCLWVACYGAGEVRRFSPAGEILEVVRTPSAPQATSLTFAGPDLRTLVITTAREHMGAADLAAHPDSGRLFVIPVDVAGLPARPWRGRPRT